MLATIATFMATQGLSALLGFLATIVKGWMDTRQAAASAKQAGSAEVAAATNKETSDANRRAADAAVNAERGDAVDDKLSSGGRQF